MSSPRPTLFCTPNTTESQTTTITLKNTDHFSFADVQDTDHQAMYSIIDSFEMGEFNDSDYVRGGLQAIFRLKNLSTPSLMIDPPHVQKHGYYEDQYRFHVLTACAARSLLDMLYKHGCIEKSVIFFDANLGTLRSSTGTGIYIGAGHDQPVNCADKIADKSNHLIERVSSYSNDFSKQQPALISIQFNSLTPEQDAAIRAVFKSLFKEEIHHLNNKGYARQLGNSRS